MMMAESVEREIVHKFNRKYWSEERIP